MDYAKYDAIQAGLGAVGSELRLNAKELMAKSEADPETKKLVSEALEAVAFSLDSLAIEVSHVAELMTK